MNDKSFRIIKIVVIFFISLSFFSCSTSDETCKVISFSTVSTFYDEIIITSWNYNPTFPGRINLVYQNNKIVKMLGGLSYNDFGSNNLFTMRNEVETNISYSGNTVNTSTSDLWDKEFVIADGKIISQDITHTRYFNYQHLIDSSQGLHTYEHNGNQIIEKKDGLIRRIFYLENGNLEKVDWFLRNSTGDINLKYEYVFSDYDNNPNLLKGKFFIEGNFFKAFSNNNYKRYDRKTFYFVNGVFELADGQSASLSFGELPADLFIEDCQ